MCMCQCSQASLGTQTFWRQQLRWPKPESPVAELPRLSPPAHAANAETPGARTLHMATPGLRLACTFSSSRPRRRRGWTFCLLRQVLSARFTLCIVVLLVASVLLCVVNRWNEQRRAAERDGKRRGMIDWLVGGVLSLEASTGNRRLLRVARVLQNSKPFIGMQGIWGGQTRDFLILWGESSALAVNDPTPPPRAYCSLQSGLTDWHSPF